MCFDTIETNSPIDSFFTLIFHWLSNPAFITLVFKAYLSSKILAKKIQSCLVKLLVARPEG
jgi:hypothetical protein